MSVAFSPEVLQSEQALENYLRAQETIDAIKAEADKPYIKGQGQLGVRDVIWVAMTSPFLCFVLFTRYVTANTIYYLGAKNLGLRLIVRTNYILGNTERLVSSFIIHGPNLLVPTLNALSPEAEEIYTHPSIPSSKIPKNLQNRFFTQISNGELHFDKISGQCAGLVNLFSYLFFQTKHFYKDEEHLLVSIMSKMNNGAGKEAALWQKAQTEYAFEGDTATPLEPLLGLKRGTKLNIKEPTREKLQALFKKIEPGFYQLTTYSDGAHRMCFYKGLNSSYAFDPNEGLFKLSSDTHLKDWIKEITSSYFGSRNKKKQSLRIVHLYT